MSKTTEKLSETFNPDIVLALEESGLEVPLRFQEAGITSFADLERHIVYGLSDTSFKLYLDPTTPRSASQLPGHHFNPAALLDEDLASFAYGPHVRADVMIIGKYPGLEEIQNRRNFVGASGKILFRELRTRDITLESKPEWYLCNACRYTVQGEKVDYKSQYYKDFLPVFLYEVFALKPAFIICLGSEAARFVLGKSHSPAKVLGHVFKKTFELGDMRHTTNVLVVVHPAAVARSAKYETLFKAGIQSFVDKYEQYEQGKSFAYAPTYEATLIKDEGDLMKLAEDLATSHAIAVDLEWVGEHPYEPGSKIRLMSVATCPERTYAIPLDEEDFKDRRQFLELCKQIARQIMLAPLHSDINIVGHNFRADMKWLVGKGIIDLETAEQLWRTGRIQDTMLGCHVLYESQDLSLKTAAAVHCGIPAWTEELKKIKAASGKNPYATATLDVLYKYACGDVHATYRLYEHIFEPNASGLVRLDADRFGLSSRQIYELEIAVQPALLRMEFNGVGVDLDRMEELRQVFEDAIEKLVQMIRKRVNNPNFNPRSTQQVAKVLYKSGEEPLIKTEKGAPSTGKDALALLARNGNELAAMILDFRYLDQAIKMYLTNDPGKGLRRYVIDGRIYPSFSQTVETGRYACHHPNLQNISNQREDDYKRILGERYIGPIRSIFAAPPGRKLIEADLTGAELCVIAWLSQDETMIEHVQRSFLPPDHPDYYDIHSSMAVRTFNLPCRPNKKEIEAAGYTHLRVAAKSIVFGRAYDRSAEAILQQLEAMGVNVTLDDVKALIQGFDSTYPKAIEYLNKLAERVTNPGYIIAPSGRIRRFDISLSDHVKLEHARREARNFPIQCTVADTMTKILILLDERLKREVPDAKIVLQIHDALMVETADENVDWIIEIIKETVHSVPVEVTDPDGNPIGKSYTFEPDIHVYQRWYEH